MTPLAQDDLEQLVRDALLETKPDGGYVTTKRWQAALMRATQHLLAEGEDGDDLRIPIVRALLELYGDSMSDADLARLVSAMLPIVARDFRPQL